MDGLSPINTAYGVLGDFMPGKCEICGKGVQFGYRVSHAHNKTKRMWHPNIQRVRVLINGQRRRINTCTSCLRLGKVAKV
jgi:large subunit ribosomal protein L28